MKSQKWYKENFGWSWYSHYLLDKTKEKDRKNRIKDYKETQKNIAKRYGK